MESHPFGPMSEELGPNSPESFISGGVNTPARSLAGGLDDAANGTQKDLTVFFIIGFIVNILVIGAFLFWAVGQWRKTKRE